MANWKNLVERMNKNAGKTFVNLNSALANLNAVKSGVGEVQDNMADRANQNLSAAANAQAAADAFNMREAQKQRDFTMAMSSTAHQREVKDLQAAGLNPVLSAGGNGAPMGSAAAAQSSNALTGVFGSMANTALNAVSALSQAQLNSSTSVLNTANQVNASVYSTQTQAKVSTYVAKLQAKTNLSMNAATNAMNERIARIQSMTQQQVAQIAGEYNLSAAELNAYVQQNASQLAYEANIYGANKSYDKAVYEKLAQRATDRLNIDQKGAYDMLGGLMHMIGAIIPG